MTKTRRTTEEIVADLQAKIAAVQAAGARRKARQNPAVKHGRAAVSSIDRAAKETADATARKALEAARGELSAWLAVEGLSVAQGVAEAATARKPGRRKAAATA
ncbi:MAG: hypothetical protein NTY35_16440 [Planctomycetota bacterium]|nr:hypothetical protein [Planctomycetota bacterium]